MIVLGIDPGLAFTGYGFIDSSKNRFKHIAHGTIETNNTIPQGARLAVIYEKISTLIQRYSPEQVGIEALYFAKNTSSGLLVAQALGVILLAVEHHKLPIREVAPNTVKKTVTGVARAEKVQVQHCVKILLGLQDIPKPDHAADALAIAITTSQTALPV